MIFKSIWARSMFTFTVCTVSFRTSSMRFLHVKYDSPQRAERMGHLKQNPFIRPTLLFHKFKSHVIRVHRLLWNSIMKNTSRSLLKYQFSCSFQHIICNRKGQGTIAKCHKKPSTRISAVFKFYRITQTFTTLITWTSAKHTIYYLITVWIDVTDLNRWNIRYSISIDIL
jgi:hypothetical protein